jgi:hypothetical protein
VAAEECLLDSSPSGSPGSIITHRDGHLMYFSAGEVHDSMDSGHSWAAPRSLELEGLADMTVREVFRLRSGRLGLLAVGDWRNEGNFDVHRLQWWTSSDEGLTWNGPVLLNPTGQAGLPYSGGALMQMANGRLVLPVRTLASAHRGISDQSSCRGRVGDVVYIVTEHGHVPEFEASFCYLSDDEGETWSRSEGEVMIWLDAGRGGLWPMDEPCVIEAPEGRLAIYGRTTLGRIYRSTSDDGGEHWSQPEPTDLASSYSPCRIVRLPRTGDLLCVWNQVSPAEIRKGFWRARLSCALSRDHGISWECFKVIDHQGVPPVGRIVPDSPALVRPSRDLGELPRDYGEVTYPSVGFHGDTVFVRYKRRIYWPERKNSDRMVAIPTSWLYE